MTLPFPEARSRTSRSRASASGGLLEQVDEPVEPGPLASAARAAPASAPCRSRPARRAGTRAAVRRPARVVDLVRLRDRRRAAGRPRGRARPPRRSAGSPSSSSSGSTSAVRNERPSVCSTIRKRRRPRRATFIRPSSNFCTQLDHAGARADLPQPVVVLEEQAELASRRRGTRRSAPGSAPRRCGAGRARSAAARARAGRGRSRTRRKPKRGYSPRVAASVAEIADSFFRPAVQGLVPYEPGQAGRGGAAGARARARRQARVERRAVRAVPGRARGARSGLSPSSTAIPTAAPGGCATALAERHGVAFEEVAVGAGADGADRLPLAGVARARATRSSAAGRRSPSYVIDARKLGAVPVKRAAARRPLRPRRDARGDQAADEARLRLPPEQPDRDDRTRAPSSTRGSSACPITSWS